MGDTEWFDVAYHVYLAGLLGGGSIIVLAGYVGDTPLGDDAAARALAHGPAYLGVVMAIAIAVGLRSGAEGGPLSVENADVRYLLLAPVSRSAVLRQPFLQRARAVAGGAGLVGGVAGLLAAQRLPGGSGAWTLWGAVFGAVVGLANTAIAVHAHAVRLRSWVATAVGAVLVGGQLWAAIGGHTGPFDTVGHLGMWGNHREPTDLIGAGLVVALAIAALFDVGRLRVEHLDRRGDLVSQLRFAVTTQDLRTVVLLRRQLSQEQPRNRPAFRMPSVGDSPTASVVRRSIQSMLRMPIARLGRVVALGAGAGVAAAEAVRGTTPAVLVCGLLLFVMGLDLIEPLSQEIDHPDLTDDLPVESGWLHLRLLVGPALVAILPALAGAAACAVVEPRTLPAAFALAVPLCWAGMTGSIVNAVRDDASIAGGESLLVPPEMAGMKNVIVMLVPLVVSSIATVSILALRARPDVRTGIQMVVTIAGYLAAFGWWIHKRADLRTTWSELKQGAMP
ncbi:MAG: DUF6297 family protein [Ilumatobacteraceae bacterium]